MNKEKIIKSIYENNEIQKGTLIYKGNGMAYLIEPKKSLNNFLTVLKSIIEDIQEETK